jgi:hypothetical protein
MICAAKSTIKWLTLVVAATVACNGDADDGSPPSAGAAACEELGSICHDEDDGDGPIAECHDVGHQAIPEQCLARYDECKQLCTAAGSGHGGAGGESHGAGGESHGGAGGESHHG